MRRKLHFLLTLALFLNFAIPALSADDSDKEWYPFSFPAKLDPNSPANIGKLVLDAPAGKHGFCKVKDGHFYFEDGTRAKFWGTNLCFSACFPDKKQAKILADRLAFFGFNAVRLHHMDFYFEPRGIFKDVDPAYKDPQKKRTGFLSEKQLSRLDYLIFLLKRRGIYIDMNLLVARHFTEADGIKDAQALGMAAKPISMFDPKLIELQKKYAKNLLTHYNPHTKLRYCDDPAIALIEITNENSIVNSWQNNQLDSSPLGMKKDAVPDYYSNQLDKLWNAWLKEKYSSQEKVENAWKSDTPPKTELLQKDMEIIPATTKWNLEQHQGASASVRYDNETTEITVTNITKTPWHIQLMTSGTPLVKDTTYLLKFDIKTDKPELARIICQQAFSPWKNLGLSETIELDKESRTVEIPFSATDNCENSKIAFIIGHSTGTYYIKNISLKKNMQNLTLLDESSGGFSFSRPLNKLRGLYAPQAIKDAKNFYTNLEKEYFKQITVFLKQELNVKVPITGTQVSSIEAQESCDFIDAHVYWDHPKFPNKKWDKNNFRIHNKSMLQDQNLGFINYLVDTSREAVKQSKPFTVTEWNHCYPNQYAYETPTLIAAKAREYDWDALFQFAFSHGWEYEPVLDEIQSYFDTIGNAQKLILTSFGSLVFLKAENLKLTINNNFYEIDSDIIQGAVGFIKNKPLRINNCNLRPNQDGAVFKINGQNIITISQIKNMNSGWTTKEKYNWGNSSTLLLKTTVNTTNPANHSK